MNRLCIAPIILFFSLTGTFISSCDKGGTEKEPVHYIFESEKLTIPPGVELPANAPKGNTRVGTFYAKGVQIYKSQVKAGSSPVSYEWVFVAPKANLYGVSNTLIGTHGAGPFWELSPTDSIFAQHFAPVRSAPSPDAAGIDWLLLMPKAGKAPSGVFADVSYIQRIATTGGKASSVQPTGAGQTTEVPYTAIYRFTKKTP